jgi:hypothetical protein
MQQQLTIAIVRIDARVTILPLRVTTPALLKFTAQLIAWRVLITVFFWRKKAQRWRKFKRGAQIFRPIFFHRNCTALIWHKTRWPAFYTNSSGHPDCCNRLSEEHNCPMYVVNFLDTVKLKLQFGCSKQLCTCIWTHYIQYCHKLRYCI